MNVYLFRVEPILSLVAHPAATLRAGRCPQHAGVRGHAVRCATTALRRGAVMLGALCGLATLPPGVAAADTGLPASSTSTPTSAAASASASDAAAPQIDFDIAAQPLEDALNRFGLVSGRSALFRSKLVAGLNSRPVHGRYAPAAALRLLLGGTGLEVKEASEGAVAALIIVPADAQTMAAAPTDAAPTDNYDAWIQMRVWEAICANARTATNDYRSLVRFGVDPAGKIRDPHLLTSSGSGRRDEALLAVLQQVRIDRAPPPGFAQPLTMLILPGRDGGPVCEGS